MHITSSLTTKFDNLPLVSLLLYPKLRIHEVLSNTINIQEAPPVDVENEPLLSDSEERRGSKEEEEEDEEVFERPEVRQEEQAIGFLGALRIPGVVEFSLR